MGTEVTIDNGVATVRPTTPEIAAALIAAAGRDGVATVSGRGGLAFRVSEEAALSAGLVQAESLEDVGAPADPPVGDGDALTPEHEGNTPPEAVVPSKGASTDTWREFLDGQGIAYTEDDRRDDLVALWENR